MNRKALIPYEMARGLESDPGRARTGDLEIRSHMLYPAELQGQTRLSIVSSRMVANSTRQSHRLEHNADDGYEHADVLDAGHGLAWHAKQAETVDQQSSADLTEQYQHHRHAGADMRG